METVGIHATAPQAGVGHTPAVQMLFVNARGAEHPVSLPIEPAQVTPAGAYRPIHTVASRVELVIGVGRGDEGDTEVAGDFETGEADGELGSHVDHIGTEAGGVVQNVAKPRKCPLDIRIEKQRHAGGPMYLRAVRLSLGAGIVGGVDPNLMAALFQRLRESEQGDPHAADHGPIDLGKQGDAHQRTLDQDAADDKAT